MRADDLLASRFGITLGSLHVRYLGLRLCFHTKCELMTTNLCWIRFGLGSPNGKSDIFLMPCGFN
ncbi:unnamed protein product [Arabis nemorensis]|uniref:Uncharacterized protein n=1 Tax=Arabis nemorensis TaxID=586526 RepID=A0A565BV06_9BRAS|nr:unnamed protein product [Arabis nemorensis]